MADPRRRVMNPIQEQGRKDQEVRETETDTSEQSLKAVIEAAIVQVCSRQMEKFEFVSLLEQHKRLAGEKQTAEHGGITGPFLTQIDNRQRKIESKRDAKKAKLEQSKGKQDESLDRVVKNLIDLARQSDRLETSKDVNESLKHLRNENRLQQNSIKVLEEKLDILTRHLSTKTEHDRDTTTREVLTQHPLIESSDFSTSTALLEIQKRLTDIETSMQKGSENYLIFKGASNGSDPTLDPQFSQVGSKEQNPAQNTAVAIASESVEARLANINEDIRILHQDYVKRSNLEGYISIFNEHRRLSEERFQRHERDHSDFVNMDKFDTSRSLLSTEQKARESLALTVQGLSETTTQILRKLEEVDAFQVSAVAQWQERELLSVKVQELSRFIPEIVGQQAVLESHAKQLKQYAEDKSPTQVASVQMAAEDIRTLEESKVLKRTFDQAFAQLSRRLEGCSHSIMALNSRYNNLSSESLVRQMIPVLDPYITSIKGTMSKFQSELQTVRDSVTSNNAQPSETAELAKVVTELKPRCDKIEVALDNIRDDINQSSALSKNELKAYHADFTAKIEHGDQNVQNFIQKEISEIDRGLKESFELLLHKVDARHKTQEDLREHVDITESIISERHKKLIADVLEAKKIVETRLDVAESDIDDTAKRLDKIEDDTKTIARRFERLVDNLDKSHTDNGLGTILHINTTPVSSAQHNHGKSTRSPMTDKLIAKPTSREIGVRGNHRSVQGMFTAKDDSNNQISPEAKAYTNAGSLQRLLNSNETASEALGGAQTVDLTGDDDGLISPDLARWGARTHREGDVSSTSTNSTTVDTSTTKVTKPSHKTKGLLKRKREIHRNGSSGSITSGSEQRKSLQKKQPRKA